MLFSSGNKSLDCYIAAPCSEMLLLSSIVCLGHGRLLTIASPVIQCHLEAHIREKSQGVSDYGSLDCRDGRL